MNTKTFLSLVAAFSFATAFAVPKTTIEFELQGVTYKHYKRKKPSAVEMKIDVMKLNKQLKKHGLDGLPTKIVLTEKSTAYWQLLMKRIAAATELVKKLEKDEKRELLFTIDGAYLYEFSPMCYRGDTQEAIAVFNGMLGGYITKTPGGFLKDEQGIEAIRYGKEKIISTDFFKSAKALKEAYEDNNPSEVEEWLEYDTSSDSILIMSNLGQQGDGTELYATYIQRCEE